MTNQLVSSTTKLKDIEDNSSKLVSLLEASIKGEDLPIELILKHNRKLKNKKEELDDKYISKGKNTVRELS